MTYALAAAVEKEIDLRLRPASITTGLVVPKPLVTVVLKVAVSGLVLVARRSPGAAAVSQLESVAQLASVVVVFQ